MRGTWALSPTTKFCCTGGGGEVCIGFGDVFKGATIASPMIKLCCGGCDGGRAGLTEAGGGVGAYESCLALKFSGAVRVAGLGQPWVDGGEGT